MGLLGTPAVGAGQVLTPQPAPAALHVLSFAAAGCGAAQSLASILARLAVFSLLL